MGAYSKLCTSHIQLNCIAITYEFFAQLKRYSLLKRNWNYIGSLSDLVDSSQNIWFILFYTLLTITISFFLAVIIAKYAYPKFINRVNSIREANDVAPLSKHSTVWDSVFLNNDGQIIEYKKNGEEISLAGCLINVPRAHEERKAIVLEGVDHWTKIVEYYDIQIDNTYVDLDNGIIINIFNLEKALEAEVLFNQRFPDGIIS